MESFVQTVKEQVYDPQLMGDAQRNRKVDPNFMFAFGEPFPRINWERSTETHNVPKKKNKKKTAKRKIV